jgi:hypothetical protein
MMCPDEEPEYRTPYWEIFVASFFTAATGWALDKLYQTWLEHKDRQFRINRLLEEATDKDESDDREEA